jgi:solute carrier family 13 (sodium-dependent dicarboxylate transporter), member 2/3/5
MGVSVWGGSVVWVTTVATPPRTRGKAKARLALVLGVCVLVVVGLALVPMPGQVRFTLIVFALAIVLWVLAPIDDIYVALLAATALALGGALDRSDLFAALGDDTIWLLIAAFVMAAGVASSGVAGRAAGWLVGRAKSVRQLAHLTTAALILTGFAIPATSGRAALALPVYIALSKVVRPRIAHAMAVLFPTVILLSAVATLIGAGAHLITVQFLTAATGTTIGFAQWLLLGLPLAVVSAHIAAEIVLWLFTTKHDRKERLEIPSADRGRFTATERTALGITGAAVLLWCTEPLHGIHPALVALLAALAITVPAKGAVDLSEALKSVPWTLLLFMASTAAMAFALVNSGAAAWLAATFIKGTETWLFMVLVVLVSTLAHLVVQSRSARSSVLIPLIIPVAVASGADPVVAAFASTAAAGFCHTLPASAKPMAMFAGHYRDKDLLRLSAVLAPVHVLLVTVFALWVWPTVR